MEKSQGPALSVFESFTLGHGLEPKIMVYVKEGTDELEDGIEANRKRCKVA